MSTSVQYPPGYLEEDHGPRVLAACSVILVITTVLLPLRFYARNLAPGQRAWDDYLLIPAYVFLLGLIACLYADVLQAGLGRHAAAVIADDPHKIERFLQLLYILDWFYVPSNMLSRVSVVCMYLRIFTDKWARAAAWTVMAFLVANCVATIIAANLECMPLAYTWDKSIQGGSCFNQIVWYQVTNIPNIVGDVMIAVLPIKTVWGLKASTARKAGIATVCLTGSIGMIASCVRTSIFYLQANVIMTDPTFSDEAFSWTAIESGMYFSAACLIGMRPLFAKFPSLLKSRTSHADGKSGWTSTFGQRTEDRLRLKSLSHGYNSQYATMQDTEDLENGSRHQSEADEVVLPLPSFQDGNRFDVVGSDKNEIRVETNIEVRRDQGHWLYTGTAGGNLHEYAYNVPAKSS